MLVDINNEKTNFFGEHPPLPLPDVLPFGPHGSNSDNIFFKIEQLLIKEKDLDNLYHSEHDKFIKSFFKYIKNNN